MKASDVVTVAVVALGAYGAWRAIKAGTDAAGAAGAWIADTAASAYDAVTDIVAAPFVYAASVPEKIVTAVHGPAVPVGGSSVQLRHTTDLPEGSYRAAEMYWSLYPNAVFYD